MSLIRGLLLVAIMVIALQVAGVPVWDSLMQGIGQLDLWGATAGVAEDFGTWAYTGTVETVVDPVVDNLYFIG